MKLGEIVKRIDAHLRRLNLGTAARRGSWCAIMFNGEKYATSMQLYLARRYMTWLDEGGVGDYHAYGDVIRTWSREEFEAFFKRANGETGR